MSSIGHLRVNWLNAESEFISSNIRVFDFAQAPDSHPMEVIVPHGALMAVSYATGHTMEPLIINNVSLKK
jgi:hypothetical protein